MPGLQDGERAIEIATAIAEAVFGGVEFDLRGAGMTVGGSVAVRVVDPMVVSGVGDRVAELGRSLVGPVVGCGPRENDSSVSCAMPVPVCGALHDDDGNGAGVGDDCCCAHATIQNAAAASAATPTARAASTDVRRACAWITMVPPPVNFDRHTETEDRRE